MRLALACRLVFIGLILRAEIALTFPFLVLCFWIKLSLPWRQRLLPTLIVGVVLMVAFGAFLVCQKPHVAMAGGAAKSQAVPALLQHVAARQGVGFAEMGTVATVDPIDGIHLDAGAHAAIGAAMAAAVTKQFS